MAIIKYPSFSVEIVIKEGDGVLNSATFSTEIDPSSTNDMVVLRKKNINKKPFILGISNWADGDFHYAANEYKGISTKGTGTGTVVSLTFSQPVDHFTLYFDEIANSIPTSITINSTTYSNDDYMFAYSQETASSTFDITINDMNEINSLEMPLMIVGVEARVALLFDNKSGLRTIRSSNSFTSDKTKPSYGILSQEGALALFDYYTEIDDLVSLGLLKSDSNVDIYFEDNLVSKKTTRQWSEIQTNEFNVELNDLLLSWQKRKVLKNHNIQTTKTAKDLYDYLIALQPDLTFVLDATTQSLLESIDIYYYYWNESTEWDMWQKLCDLALLYVYMRADGNIQVISQDRIDELITLNNSNPIVIPYTRIDGTPKIERLENNKIEKVSVATNNLDKTLNSIISTTDTISFYNESGTDISSSNLDDYGVKISTGNPHYSIIKHKVLKEDIPGMFFNENVSYNYSGLYVGISGNTLSAKSNVLAMVEKSNALMDYVLENWDTMTVDEIVSYLSSTAAYSIYDDYIIFTIRQWVKTDGGSFVLNYRYNLLSSVLTEKNEKSDYGNVLSEKDYLLQSNEFYNSNVLTVPIKEYNAAKILNKFTGKQSISFRMAIDNLYDKTGNLVYNINNGNILQVLDLIQLKKTDGTYDAKIWQVTKVEIEITGSKWANVEAIEI